MATTKQKKEKDITVADIIVAVAIAAFAIMSFFGLSFSNGQGSSIIIVSLYIALFIAIIFALTRVKRVENYFGRWKVVEIALLIFYVFIAISLSTPMVNALSATSEKDSLIDLGKADIATIRTLFEEYESRENSALEEMENSFHSLKGATLDSNAKTVTTTRFGNSSYSEYCKNLKNKYLGDGGEGTLNYKAFYNLQDSLLSNATSALENWNLVKVSAIASNLDSQYKDIARRLTEISTQRHPDENQSHIPFKFVVVRDNNSYRYIIDEQRSKNLEIDYKALIKQDDLLLAAKIKTLQTPLAIFIAIFIYALMLVGYFAAPRSSTVDISARSKKGTYYNDGGIDLY